MQLRITLDESASIDETQSLYTWLAQDPDARRAGRVSVGRATPPAGAMGAGLDLINVVLTNSIAGIGVVVAAVGTWHASHRRSSSVHLEIGPVKATINSDDPELLRRVAAELIAATGITATEAASDQPE